MFDSKLHTVPAWLLPSAQDLVRSLARKHFPEVPNFEALDDLAGVLSQLDNMTTALTRKQAFKQVGTLKPCREGWFADIENAPLNNSEPLKLFIVDREAGQ